MRMQESGIRWAVSILLSSTRGAILMDSFKVELLVCPVWGTPGKEVLNGRVQFKVALSFHNECECRNPLDGEYLSFRQQESQNWWIPLKNGVKMEHECVTSVRVILGGEQEFVAALRTPNAAFNLLFLNRPFWTSFKLVWQRNPVCLTVLVF